MLSLNCSRKYARHLQFTLCGDRTGYTADDLEQCTVFEQALLAAKA